MKIYLIIIALLSIMLVSCAGSDPVKADTTAPDKPILFKHIGDTGDGLLLSSYSPDSILINEDNTGIDAEPDGDWIKLQWAHMLDNDISTIRIFRYATGYAPTKIDSILPDRETYLDRLNNTGALNARETVWHYYIHAVDKSGNYSKSDTVSYRLINKSQLISPQENAILANSNITFSFLKSGSVSKLRLIVMDDFKQYLWHKDIYVTEDSSFNVFYEGASLPNGTYYWRVDSFGDPNEDGIYISGSESRERLFTIE